MRGFKHRCRGNGSIRIPYKLCAAVGITSGWCGNGLFEAGDDQNLMPTTRLIDMVFPLGEV